MRVDDRHISTMVDVARSAGTGLSAEKKAALEELLAAGYVATAEDQRGPEHRYKLTPAGQAVLDDRGVGANES